MIARNPRTRAGGDSTALAIRSNVAYAVGHKLVGSEVHGVVLRATSGGGAFGAFQEVDTGMAITACTVGIGLDTPDVLNAVAIAPNGDVWTAGACGRSVRGASNGTVWSEYKSETSAHVIGISIVEDLSPPQGACHRQGETGQVVVRFQPQGP